MQQSTVFPSHRQPPPHHAWQMVPPPHAPHRHLACPEHQESIRYRQGPRINSLPRSFVRCLQNLPSSRSRTAGTQPRRAQFVISASPCASKGRLLLPGKNTSKAGNREACTNPCPSIYFILLFFLIFTKKAITVSTKYRQQ